MKVRSEVVYTCPNYKIDFIDEPFKFLRKVQTFMTPVVQNYKWHEHKPMVSKSRLYDPLRMLS